MNRKLEEYKTLLKNSTNNFERKLLNKIIRDHETISYLQRVIDKNNNNCMKCYLKINS